MGFLESLFLGLLQGVAEFLPISSSGHLVLAETYLHLDVEKLKVFDVVLHIGTLTAIIVYFWKDFCGLIKGFLAFLRLYKTAPHIEMYQRLIGYIIIATIPAVIVGLLFGDAIDYLFRNAWYVALFMIMMGEIYILAERFLAKYKIKREITWKNALIIGLAQAIALAPGISRSGSTIAAGLFLGVSREKAARFSFLMAMPAIFGAGMLTFVKELKAAGAGGAGTLTVELMPMIVGFIASFAASLATVYFLMRYLKNNSLRPFSYYLFALGGAIILYNIIW